MNELIKIEEKDGKRLVSARELYEKLEVKTRFSLWIEQYIKYNNKYGFEENQDFTSVVVTTVVNNDAKRDLQDYALTINMAKEISMITGTEKGRLIRKYFIECERQLKENHTNFASIDNRLGVLQELVNQCDTSQARDRIRIKMADLICKTRKTAATAYKDTETVLESIDLEEYVSNKDFEYVKIKDAYNDYCKIDNDPVGRTTFCRCVYDHGYTRKQIKDKQQRTQYVFSKVGGR